MSDETTLPMREPGAAIGAVPDGILLRGVRQDRGRNRSLVVQVSPAVLTGAEFRPSAPSSLGRDFRLFPIPTDGSHWEARRDPDKPAQHLPDLAEIEAGLEMLDQGEHVALGAARRLPPAMAAMVDDDNLARTTPVFQRVARALALVERPTAPELLEEGGTIHAASEQLQLRIV